MIKPDLLALLCCPETHQQLTVADVGLIERLNQSAAGGTLKNRAGTVVVEKMEGGLLRQDARYVYPIHHNIPVMLIEEAIPLDPSMNHP